MRVKMSGHSKWSTIKRKKGANDAKRGKLFAKLVKAIEVAAKNGGTDPSANASLYQAISKAKSNSVPNDNIERALKRIDGDSEAGEIFELTYEGYGPHGVAILINCLTDNKNRTSSDVRAVLTKNNGSMGNPGSVAYLFELKAIFQFDNYDDDLIELAINNNCLDIQESNNGITLEFEPSNFKTVYESFNSSSYQPSNAEIANIPSSSINLDPTQFTQITKLIESLEDLDDVQDVFANFDIEEKDLESLLSE
jgi:YebC/PmpR family DNA-binding regulatory protein